MIIIFIFLAFVVFFSFLRNLYSPPNKLYDYSFIFVRFKFVLFSYWMTMTTRSLKIIYIWTFNHLTEKVYFTYFLRFSMNYLWVYKTKITQTNQKKICRIKSYLNGN